MTSSPMPECREMELSLGVLVLGALEPAERPAVEAHLAACPRCTAILAELAPLPGLLHRLDPIEPARPAPPVRPSASASASASASSDSPSASTASSPPSAPQHPLLGVAPLRDRLIEAARAERVRRQRRWVAGVSAAAVLVGVLLSVAVSGGFPGQGHTTPATAASATDPHSAVHADVRLTPDGTGTALTLHLAGVRPEEHCRLVAVDGRGRQQVAAAWVATYAGRAAVTGHTSLRPDQITRLLVVTDAGRMLVQVPIRG